MDWLGSPWRELIGGIVLVGALIATYASGRQALLSRLQLHQAQDDPKVEKERAIAALSLLARGLQDLSSEVRRLADSEARDHALTRNASKSDHDETRAVIRDFRRGR